MSFGISAATWTAIGVLASTGVGIYSAQQQRRSSQKALSEQKKANAQAEANALAQEKAATEAANAANMKTPDTAAMMSSAMLSGKAGQSGTMLTGPKGITKDKLGLQKNTLLGS